MLIELSITVLGIGCSLPALFTEYSSEFAAAEWTTWVKMLPQSLLLVACILRLIKKMPLFGMLLGVLGLFATYFCMLFNSRASASVVCQEYPDACSDDAETSCSDSVLESWEGLLYLIGLCFMTIGSTILVRDYSNSRQEKKVQPVTNN